MGGGGGPTTTFTLTDSGLKSAPNGAQRRQGRVDQSNTLLATLEPGTPDNFVLHSILNSGGDNIWGGEDLENPPALSADNIGNRDDINVWDMSDDGKFHIFGRNLGFPVDNAAGLVIARLGGTDLGTVEDATFFNTVRLGVPNPNAPDPADQNTPLANKGIGRNVAIHPDGTTAIAVGNFQQFPVNADAAGTLDFVKYTLSATEGGVAATDADFPFSYGDVIQQGMGTSLDLGGNFAVIGPGTETTGDFQHVAQLLDLNSDFWDAPGGDVRGRSFGFGSNEDGAGAVVRITDDGEHVLYTTSVPGEQAGSFRILKTELEGGAATPMEVLATVPVSFAGNSDPGKVGDITNIDDENILVVLSVSNNNGEAGDGIVAYAGRPNDPQLITPTPILIGLGGEAGTLISSIKITKAGPNENFTPESVKTPRPEEGVIVAVTASLLDGTNITQTFNLNN